jgi:DNA-binding NtrC family response regulator
MNKLALKTESPDAIPQVIPLRPGAMLGRSRESTMVLHDETVSREHCTFKLHEGEWVLVNLSQLNYTQLNGREISEEKIKPGDRIRCGSIDLEIVESTEDTQSAQTPIAEDLTQTLARTQRMRVQSAEHAGTSDVFAKLLDSNHELLGSETIEHLMNTLYLQLHDLFSPVYIWIKYGIENTSAVLDKGTPIPLSHEFDGLLRYSREKDQSLSLVEHDTVTYVSAAPDDQGIQIVLQCDSNTSENNEINLEVLNCISTMCNQISAKLFSEENETKPQETVFEEISNELILIGSDKSVRELKGRIKRTARSDAHILIQGETGVGKEIVSKMLHAYSLRKGAPIKIINCAAIPSELFESEMFGHEKDSFTGATSSRTGAFESTDNGTLVLDEITELTVDQQAKLLRAIEYGTIQRIGQDKTIEVNVRIIGITNQEITELVAQGQFRSDLYHRLTESALTILPLRERKEDIAPLVKYFLFRANLSHQKSVMGVTSQAMDALMSYDWPGNVRELKNVIHHGVNHSETNYLTGDQLNLGTVPGSQSTGLNLPITTLKEMEMMYAKYVYEYCDGDVERAAELLGIGVSTLYKKLK